MLNLRTASKAVSAVRLNVCGGRISALVSVRVAKFNFSVFITEPVEADINMLLICFAVDLQNNYSG